MHKLCQQIMFLQLTFLAITGCSILLVVAADSSSPLTVPVQAIKSTSNDTCPYRAELAEATRLMTADVLATLIPGLTEPNPASSCSALPANSASGYYWILPATGPPAVQMYCDFNRRCGCDGDSSTWTRVAFLNMSDPNEVCPSPWITSPVRSCGTNRTTGCLSVIYPTAGLRYSRVCGRAIAYQYGGTLAFFSLIIRGILTVEGNYLDGVALTHGSIGSRQHIWSFASAHGENGGSTACACSNNNENWLYSTAFVGNDYFCDSGNRADYGVLNRIYSEDRLWDGRGCGSVSSCCQFNNPPWFCKTLPEPTTDDLEVRICVTGPFDTPVELIELYVQ